MITKQIHNRKNKEIYKRQKIKSIKIYQTERTEIYDRTHNMNRQ